MKRFISVCLLLCLLLTLLPAGAFAADTGRWEQDSTGWRYRNADGTWQRGAVLFQYGDEFRRFLFDWDGYLQTGDKDGEVYLLGNRYYINPYRSLSNPNSCWAVSDYTRAQEGVGVTYYDANGISYAGWLKQKDGGYVYQTTIRRPGVKDVNIFVVGPQYIPESLDPNYPAGYGVTIPAGRYFFDNYGRLVQQEGLYYGADGYVYYVTGRGQIIWQGPVANARGALANRQSAEAVQASMRPMQERMLNRMNNARIQNGSTVISLRDSLCLAATMRAMEMARMHSTQPVRPDGSSWNTILFSTYESEEKGTQIEYTEPNAEERVFEALSSMDAKYRYFGVGKCTDVSGQTYYAVIFSEQGGSVLQ